MSNLHINNPYSIFHFEIQLSINLFILVNLDSRFHVLDLCTFASRLEPKRVGFLEPDHQMPLLEGALTLLCMILGIGTHLGDKLKMDFVTFVI